MQWEKIELSYCCRTKKLLASKNATVGLCVAGLVMMYQGNANEPTSEHSIISIDVDSLAVMISKKDLDSPRQSLSILHEIDIMTHMVPMLIRY